MCLLAIAWHAHAEYPLVVSANRDEFYGRPTRPMDWWEDAPILAGRDLEAGGTWLGLARNGRFAALTNVRGAPLPPAARSRGTLVAGFLQSADAAQQWAQELLPRASAFAGFNLLVCDGETLVCLSNHPLEMHRLEPGVHALGNAMLGQSWPKIELARAQLADAMGAGEFALDKVLTLLSSRRTSAAQLLPDTGLDPALEELLSSPFIVSEEYGTRASTALIAARDGAIEVAERSFERGQATGERRFSFTAEPRGR